MKNFKMTIAYDKTRYKGWQIEILEEKERTLAGCTAPAQGLTLMRVGYGEVGRLQ